MRRRTSFGRSIRSDWAMFCELSVVALCVTCVGQAGLSAQVGRLSIEAHIARLTGPNAVDCGRHGARTNDGEAMTKSLNCGIDAAMRGKPFRIIKDEQGIDSLIAHGLLGRADGKILMFSYDSAPCGGPRCGELFETEPCSSSPSVTVDQRGRRSFTCKK
jgi:hypothetical protein